MRKSTLKKAQQGFTLVELMIVVAIIGILAVLAVFGVRKYIANAKTAEARNTLGQISKDASGAFDREKANTAAPLADGAAVAYSNSLCTASTPVPATMGPVTGQKYQSNGADGQDYNTGSATAGWKCLKFVLDAPQYYQYQYEFGVNRFNTLGDPTANGFAATAQGDLNGDGVFSQFAMLGTVTNGRVKLAPALAESNPEE